MKYVIDIPRNLIDKVRHVLTKGEYDNISELIITALENQIILEEGEKIQEDLFSTVVKMAKVDYLDTYKKSEGQDFSKWISIKSFSNITTLPMPETKDPEYTDTNYNDNWLWGQINRIFPIKLGLRILGNMQQEKGDFVSLKEFHRKAGEVARGFGFQLLKIDMQLGRKRDERVSTALPIGKNGEKAVLRYKTHFLANKRADKILYGAMTRLKFANIQNLNETEKIVGITEEGLEFDKLKNPILDVSFDSEQTISDEETDFYVKHIKSNVPEELNPFSHILDIIKNGAITVTEIDKELKKSKQKWTDVVVTTQRSGALGRMSELGLLQKNKKGIRVTYQISEKGEIFLNRK